MKLIPLLLALMIVPAQALVTELDSQLPALEVAIPDDLAKGGEPLDVHGVVEDVVGLLDCDIGFPINITGFGAITTDTDAGEERFLHSHHWHRWHVNRTAIYETVQEPIAPVEGLLAHLSPVDRVYEKLVGWDVERWLESREWKVVYDLAWEASYIEIEKPQLDTYVSLAVLEEFDIPTRIPTLLCDGETIYDTVPSLDDERFEAYHQHVNGLILDDRYARGTVFHGHHAHHANHGHSYHGHSHHGHSHHGHHGHSHFLHESGWHVRLVDWNARLATPEDEASFDHASHGHHGHGHHGHHGHGHHVSALISQLADEVVALEDDLNGTLGQEVTKEQVTTNDAGASMESTQAVRASAAVPLALLGTGFLLFFTRKFW